MIIDFEKSETPIQYACDVAIVGGGAVGITLAIALSRAGVDVLLLEAGGLSLETSSQSLYRGQSTNPIFAGLQEGRFRLLGGTTNFWGGQLATFDPMIFEKRQWLPAVAWPFRRTEIEPYYTKAFDLLGLNDCLENDAAVWNALRTHPPDLDETLDVILTRWAPDPNFARLFRHDLDATHLRVLIHANVTAMETDATNGSVKRIHLRTISGRKGEVRASRVALACGTIEIARLLQLPLHDGTTPPWQTNPWLGRAFFDHVDCTAAEVKATNERAFHDMFDNILLNGFKYQPKIKLSRDVQEKAGLLEVAGQFAFQTRYSDHLENLKLMIRALRRGRIPDDLSKLPSHIFTLARFIVPLAYRYVKANRIFSLSDGGILLRLMSEQWPDVNSTISLCEKRDALGLPTVVLDWNIADRQMESLSRFAEYTANALKKRGLAEVKIAPLLAARNPDFLRSADDGFHQMGGTRMASTASEGVVDSNLRVFGTNNLYVAGAAVFPTTGFANPTFTAIALGLRLADHLGAKQ